MSVTLEIPKRESPATPADRNWQPDERTFATFDGTELFYRHWSGRSAAGTSGRESAPKTLLLFHRGHEHSGRWQSFVEDLNLTDTAVFAYDARGHGRSPGE